MLRLGDGEALTFHGIWKTSLQTSYALLTSFLTLAPAIALVGGRGVGGRKGDLQGKKGMTSK